MKSIVFTFIAVAAAVLSASVYAHPAWNCTDAAQWNAAAEAYKAEKNKDGLCMAIVGRHYSDGFASFAELRAYAESRAAEFGLQAGTDRFLEQLGIAIANARLEKYYADAWEALKDHAYSLYFVMFDLVRMSADAKYDFLVPRVISRWGSDPTQSGRSLSCLYDVLPNVSYDDAKVLADLKKINRKLSVHLTGKYKEKWEPVVAQLRTVMTTY